MGPKKYFFVIILTSINNYDNFILGTRKNNGRSGLLIKSLVSTKKAPDHQKEGNEQMKQLKLQNIIGGRCEYICGCGRCNRKSVVCINNQKYCGQHCRIIIQNILSDYETHIFQEI